MDEPKDRKIIIYDTGGVYWCYESEIFDPPEEKPRENYKGYNEKEDE